MTQNNKIKLRKYPYPYRAAMAICSDLDETPIGELYFEICRYLNTFENTAIGKGVGLEVGNSIYFDMPKDQFSYWNTDDSGRIKIRTLIRAGYIDCLHSFGDFAKDRSTIFRNWNELRSHDCVPRVWIDHAQAASNLDPDIMQGEGAVQDSPAYHTDLSFRDGGIEYVWKGRVTSIIAQNAGRNYRGIFNSRHALDSLRTMLVEFVKGFLGHIGSKKYSMHAMNRVLRPTSLSDGTHTLEFMRCNPSWAGVSVFEKGRDIGNVLTSRTLNVLASNEGCSILYTHLGKIHDERDPFGEAGRRGFECLSERYHAGEILVLSTQRLLDYVRLHEVVKFHVLSQGDRIVIKIDSSSIPSGVPLNGLTWFVDNPDKVDVYLDDEKIEHLRANEADCSGTRSISIPITKLIFPSL